ncbi:CBS domain-containing protein [Nitrospira defluvii]|nr:CBS domain-containing protein [Nitrospira defluvii]
MIPKIEALMSKKVHRIDAPQSVQIASEEMVRLGVGSLLVMCDGKDVGMVTEVDIIRKVVAKKRQPSAILIEEIMTSPLITIDAHETIVDANSLMEQRNIRHLAVTEADKVIGIVSVRDFLHPLTFEEGPEERAMQMATD